MPLTKYVGIHQKAGRVSFAAILLFIALAGPAVAIAHAQEQPTVASAQDDQGAADAAKSRVLQVPKGSYVEVHMTDGRTLEGLMGDVETQGFMLQTVRKNRLTNRMVRFEEMESVTPPAGSQPRGGTLELTLDRGNMVVGLETGGVNLDVTFRTPPKVANNLAAHVTINHLADHVTIKRKDR
jgi:hypothetical protein